MSLDTATTLLATLARWCAYLGVAAALGAATFAWLSRGVDGLRAARAWGHAGAVLLLVAHAGRLAAQSMYLGDPDAWLSWDSVVLMATRSRWGAGWRLQVVAAGLGLAAFMGVRAGRAARPVWLVAGLLAAVTLPLTGHAAADPTAPIVAQALQGVHVSAAAAWLGTLALLVVTTWPHAGADAIDGSRERWRRFSSLARVCAAAVLLTGGLRIWQMLGGLDDLWATPWGRALALKLGATVVVAALGLDNWRRRLPAFHDRDDDTLRTTAGAEVALAGVVFLLTAYLTGLDHGHG